MDKLFYNKQYLDKKDYQSVFDSLKSKLITGGNFVDKFEYLIKSKVKSKYALSCNNGTSAIYLALRSIRLKKNDVVILPSINFIASFSMSKLLGAKVYLADVSPITGQMTPDTLKECIRINRIKKIKLIITMYLGGSPNNVIDFYKIKKRYNCYLIEDACHALGAAYYSKEKKCSVGGCKHADISTFSFHPVKSITTGEGGALTTNNKKLYDQAKELRSHGIMRNKKNYYHYEINQLSFNFRLSDINCALGVSQIKKLEKIIIKRNQLFKIYVKKLMDLKKYIHIPNLLKKFSAHHLMLISIKKFNYKKKNNLIKFLNKNGIFPQFHYIPLYRHKAVKSKIDGIYKNNGAEKYRSTFLSLPLFYELNISSIDKVVNLLKKYFTKYEKK